MMHNSAISHSKERNQSKSLFGVFLFILISFQSLGQGMSVETHRVQTSLEMQTSRPDTIFAQRQGTVGWDINLTTFFRDTEFMTRLNQGYTAIGFFLNPTLNYTLTPNVLLTGGMSMMGVAGYDGFRLINPIVRVDYQPFSWLRIVMGTLYGTVAHGCYEPLFSNERYIYENQENGVQLFTSFRHWQSDTWVSWETLLEPGQMHQERFTFGSIHRIYLLRPRVTGNSKKTTFDISLPLQAVVSHRGGQFSGLDTCMETIMDGAAGLAFDLNHPLRGINRISLEFPVMGYNNGSSQDHRHTKYPTGWGIYPILSAEGGFKNETFIFQGAFWHAHHYLAGRASYIFQSLSWYDPWVEFPERNMYTIRLGWQHSSRWFSFGADVELYHDFYYHSTEPAIGVYAKANISSKRYDSKQ